jgi:hypothetical protein
MSTEGGKFCLPFLFGNDAGIDLPRYGESGGKRSFDKVGVRRAVLRKN